MKWLTGLAAGLALSAGTVHAADKWDMPTAYVDSNYHTQNGKLFAEAVGVCTGGDLEIVVHGGGTLFKGGEIKRAVQTGRAPIGERLLSAHQSENAVFGFDSVPFLASSFEASDRLWQAARGRLSEILAEQNLVLLYAVPWPPQGMYFKREIGGVADMGGIKFRTNNAATARLAELAKMLPVHVEAAELGQALATGVADAFMSSSSTGYDHKVWEHMSYFYDVRAWLPRNYVFVNMDAFDAARREHASRRANPELPPFGVVVGGSGRHDASTRVDRLVYGTAQGQRHERAGAGRAACRRPRGDRCGDVGRMVRGRGRNRRSDNQRLQSQLAASANSSPASQRRAGTWLPRAAASRHPPALTIRVSASPAPTSASGVEGCKVLKRHTGRRDRTQYGLLAE